MLVFALNLKNIEEVGRRGVDLNQVLICRRCRVCKIRDLELLRALS